jgi:hypothetical protein
MDTQVAELLGGERVLGASVKSNLDLAHAIRQGLPAQAAVELADLIPHLGPLQGVVRLTPQQSDAVVRTARTLAKAIDVLGDKKKAVHWLTTPNRALGGEIPITLLDTSAGAYEVEAVLDRIEYGVYS